MDKEQKVKNCLACKITSICCLFGIGVYLINTAKASNSNSKKVVSVLGIGTILLGIGEVFDRSPFRSYNENNAE